MSFCSGLVAGLLHGLSEQEHALTSAVANINAPTPRNVSHTDRTEMIQISKRVEYALRAVIYLASLPPGCVESFRDIAEQQKVPKDFLAKILRSLVDAGVLRSVRGSAGGFALQMDPRQISFLDVIVATEGPIALNDCCAAGEGCVRMGTCSMETVWRRAEQAMLEVFRQTYISDVMQKPATANPTPALTFDVALSTFMRQAP